jgi:hypothetical protein
MKKERKKNTSNQTNREDRKCKEGKNKCKIKKVRRKE